MAMIQKKVQEGLGLVEREMEVGKFEYDLIYKTRPDLMILRDVSLSHLYDLLFEGPIVDLGLLRCKRTMLADDHIGWIILILYGFMLDSLGEHERDETSGIQKADRLIKSHFCFSCLKRESNRLDWDIWEVQDI